MAAGGGGVGWGRVGWGAARCGCVPSRGVAIDATSAGAGVSAAAPRGCWAFGVALAVFRVDPGITNLGRVTTPFSRKVDFRMEALPWKRTRAPPPLRFRPDLGGMGPPPGAGETRCRSSRTVPRVGKDGFSGTRPSMTLMGGRNGLRWVHVCAGGAGESRVVELGWQLATARREKGRENHLSTAQTHAGRVGVRWERKRDGFSRGVDRISSGKSRL